MYFVCALFAGFGLIGLVPLKNKACHVGVAFLQIAGIAAALLLLPENSFFFNFDIPKWLDKVCAGALWFAVLRLLMRMDKLDSFTAVQGTSVGLACAAALFVTIPLSAVFSSLPASCLPSAPSYASFLLWVPKSRHHPFSKTFLRLPSVGRLFTWRHKVAGETALCCWRIR